GRATYRRQSARQGRKSCEAGGPHLMPSQPGLPDRDSNRTAARRRADAIRLGLMRGFELDWRGRSMVLPVSAQRVIAFLALRDRPARRSHVAGTLWVDVSEERALGKLRSTLW